jgi:hypothetical protein
LVEFRYWNVPKGACNMLSMQLADASLRHAGAAGVFGPDVELKPEEQSAVFEKQRPDRWKMNQTEICCVTVCLYDSGTRHSRPQKLLLVGDSLCV